MHTVWQKQWTKCSKTFGWPKILVGALNIWNMLEHNQNTVLWTQRSQAKNMLLPHIRSHTLEHTRTHTDTKRRTYIRTTKCAYWLRGIGSSSGSNCRMASTLSKALDNKDIPATGNCMFKYVKERGGERERGKGGYCRKLWQRRTSQNEKQKLNASKTWNRIHKSPMMMLTSSRCFW